MKYNRALSLCSEVAIIALQWVHHFDGRSGVRHRMANGALMVREEFVAMGAHTAAQADHTKKEQESTQLQEEMDQNKKTIVEIDIGLKEFLRKKRKRDAAPAKRGGGLMRFASQGPEDEDVQDDNNGNLEQSSSQNIAADFFHNLQQDGGAPRGASACLPAEC